MNKRIQELMQEADLRCSETRSVQEMHRLTVKECIQKLIDHGYDDAATCLTKELSDV